MWDLPDIRSTWEAIGISFDSFDEWEMKNPHDFSSDSAAKLMYLDSIYQHSAGVVSKSLNGDSCPLAKEVRLACDQLSITGCSDYADRFIRGERLSVNLHHDYVEKTKCYTSAELSETLHEDEHQLDPSDLEGAYCITYYYGDGGAPVYVKRISGSVDARRAALYCEFMCEEKFGSNKMLSNLGVGSLLVTFYGFQHHSAGPYSDRAAWCGEKATELLADKSLYREKLYEYMEPHIIRDGNDTESAYVKPIAVEEMNAIHFAKSKGVYCIYHSYDVGNQRVYLVHGAGSVSAKDTALFLQFKTEEIYGESAWLSNLGIASLMIQFYGFQQCCEIENCEMIDMHFDREYATTTDIYEALMSKVELQRDGLKEQIKFFLRPID